MVRRNMYYFYLISIVILLPLSLLGWLSTIWLSLIVSMPTFGYLVYAFAKIFESYIYTKVLRRRFGWQRDKYLSSWFHIVFAPLIFISGYGLGVLVTSSHVLITSMLSVATLIYVYDGLFRT